MRRNSLGTPLLYLVTAIVAVVIVTISPLASSPEMLRYEARLTDDAGVPITGTHGVVFTVYDASTGGTSLWTSGALTLSLGDGLLSHPMGCGQDAVCGTGDDSPIASSVFSGTNRWLQVEVDGLPLEPRQQLASVPYAHSADRLGDTVVVDSVNDYVGIGVASPQAPLELAAGPNWTTSNWDKSLRLGDGDAIVWDTGVYSYGIGASSSGAAMYLSGSPADDDSGVQVQMVRINAASQEIQLGSSGTRVGIGTDPRSDFVLDVESGLGPTSWVGVKSSPGTAFAGGLLLHQDNTYGWQLSSAFTGSSSSADLKINLVNIATGNPVALGDQVIIGARLNVASIPALGSSIHVCSTSGGGVLSQCSSSRRFKEEIEGLDLGGVETALALSPRQFQWISTGEADLGFVAEEVAAIDPLLATYDKDGSIVGVKYSQLTAVLVKAIQEQNAQLTEKSSRIESLETRVNRLESLLRSAGF